MPNEINKINLYRHFEIFQSNTQCLSQSPLYIAGANARAGLMQQPVAGD